MPYGRVTALNLLAWWMRTPHPFTAVIFPIIIMGILLGFGMKPQTITKLKERKRVEIRLFTGIILIFLALLLHLHII